jgi:YggT family protein
MSFISYLFKFLGSIISIYAFVCVIRIFLTWIPGVEYSQFGNFIKSFCDPWLNLFKKFNPAHGLGIDFSPIIAIGVLYIISTVFQQIAYTQRISIGIILAIILNMSWSICSSVITIFIVIVVLRWLSMLFNWTNPFWYNLESAVTPVSAWLRSHLFGNRFMKPNTLMGLTLLSSIAVQFLGTIIIHLLTSLLQSIPF